LAQMPPWPAESPPRPRTTATRNEGEAVNRNVPFHLIHVLDKCRQSGEGEGLALYKGLSARKKNCGVAGDVHVKKSWWRSGARRTGAGLGGLRRAEKTLFLHKGRRISVKIQNCFHRPSVKGQSLGWVRYSSSRQQRGMSDRGRLSVSSSVFGMEERSVRWLV